MSLHTLDDLYTIKDPIIPDCLIKEIKDIYMSIVGVSMQHGYIENANEYFYFLIEELQPWMYRVACDIVIKYKDNVIFKGVGTYITDQVFFFNPQHLVDWVYTSRTTGSMIKITECVAEYTSNYIVEEKPLLCEKIISLIRNELKKIQ